MKRIALIYGSKENKVRRKALEVLGELISPADIAETILFLASEQARMITGQVIKMSGGKGI